MGAQHSKQILALLNKILETHSNSEIMAKLNELEKLAAKPVAICSDNVLTNCIAGDNYGPLTVNGYVPPPFRHISAEKLSAAVQVLRSIPPGLKVSFVQIGDYTDEEIHGFFGEVENLFVHGGAQIVDETNIMNFTSASDVNPSHGEGVGCYASKGLPEETLRAVSHALALIGSPCRYRFPGGGQGGVITIAIGTRISMPR